MFPNSGIRAKKRHLRAQSLAARRPQGGLATGHPQVAAANRGDGADCPLAGRLLVGKGSRHLHRGGGAEGARCLFEFKKFRGLS
ncbi:hypothetical protein GW17_00057863 [Ensete ventricosum]|nr:hypothetical protein GW17_00057863 [Ensete ventricosum]RZS26685.1 hypothetical protein BHM03_00060056 [Ensete ventricosum]